jgi:hypothetical protein
LNPVVGRQSGPCRRSGAGSAAEDYVTLV